MEKELAVAVSTAVDAPTPSLGLVPATADASTCAMGMCRLVAELRSRACMALSYHIGDKEFCRSLLVTSIPSGQSCMSLLSTQADECFPGERLSVVSSHCESLRMLYRDCSRPAPPHHAPQVIKVCTSLSVSALCIYILTISPSPNILCLIHTHHGQRSLHACLLIT